MKQIIGKSKAKDSYNEFKALLTSELTSLISDQHVNSLVSTEESLYQTALYYFQNNQLEQAEEAFTQLSLLSPNNSSYGHYMGAIWFQMGHYQRALELFCHLAALPTATDKTLQWSALCLQNLHRLDEAQACLDLSQQVSKIN